MRGYRSFTKTGLGQACAGKATEKRPTVSPAQEFRSMCETMGWEPEDIEDSVEMMRRTEDGRISLPHFVSWYSDDGMVRNVFSQVRKPSFLRHLILKTEHLPRQARDTHRENSQKRGASSHSSMTMRIRSCALRSLLSSASRRARCGCGRTTCRISSTATTARRAPRPGRTTPSRSASGWTAWASASTRRRLSAR